MADPQDNPLIPPGQKPPMGNPLLPPGFVPPPPPPVSPSLGFQAYASDPQNAMKIQHAMIAPGSPLQPNAPPSGGMFDNSQFSALNPPGQPPANSQPPSTGGPTQPPITPTVAQPSASATAPQAAAPPQAASQPQPAARSNLMPPQAAASPNPMTPPGYQAPGSALMPPGYQAAQAKLGTDSAELQRLQKTGSGASQVKNPWLKGLGMVGDFAAGALLGKGAAAIPGTTAHNQWLQQQAAGRVGQDQSAMTFTQKQAQEQAQLANTQANTANTASEMNARDNPPEKADEWEVQPTDQGLLRINKSTGEAKLLTDPTGKPYGKADKPGTVHETMSGLVMVGPDGVAKPVMDPKTGKQLQGNLQKPPVVNVTPPKQMVLVPQPDGSSKAIEVTPGVTVPAGATTVGANGKAGEKINADEQKRADMGRNINENIDQLDEILTRRPDLFGPIAGRMTGLKNAMGSDDPDVAKLMTIRHNLGMVGQSVHGMRSASGVESQANALVNSFHNSPEATRAALQSMRQSAQTFLTDESNRVSKTPNAAPAGNPMTPPAAGGAKPNPMTPPTQAPKSYSQTATGQGGHKIGSNDGKTWFDVKTGKAVQ